MSVWSSIYPNPWETLSFSSSVFYPRPHTHTSTHTYAPGAWHVSLSPVFGQLSCDTPSTSAFDYHQSSSARPGSVEQSRVRALCWVLSHTGSVRRGSCNTCGGKQPSGFSGPRAHGWQFTTFLVQTGPETVSQYQIEESVTVTDPLSKTSNTVAHKMSNSALHLWHCVMLFLHIMDTRPGSR